MIQTPEYSLLSVYNIITSLLLLALLATTSLWFSNPNETNAGKIDTVLSSELCNAVSLWLTHKISLDILC